MRTSEQQRRQQQSFEAVHVASGYVGVTLEGNKALSTQRCKLCDAIVRLGGPKTCSEGDGVVVYDADPRASWRTSRPPTCL